MKRTGIKSPGRRGMRQILGGKSNRPETTLTAADLDWSGVPDAIRNDPEFVRLAVGLKIAERRGRDNAERDQLKDRMRARWNQLVGSAHA